MRRAALVAATGRRRRAAGSLLELLPDLVLDIDPAVTASIVAGTGVASITDQRSGAVFAQATGSAQPTLVASSTLNNMAALRFAAASSQCLTNAATAAALFPSAATLFVIASLNAESVYSIYDTTPGNNSLWRFTTLHGYLGTFRSTRIEAYPEATGSPAYMPPTTGAHLFVIRSDATRYRWTLDGASAGEQAGAYSAGTTHALGCLSGLASSFFNGDVGRVFAVPRYVADAEIVAVREFAQPRWGLA